MTIPQPSKNGRGRSAEDRLFNEGFVFSFFQAVHVLERLYPERRPVGRDADPAKEVVRFRSHVSLSFPPSEIYEVEAPTAEQPQPLMDVWIMGLAGPTGTAPLPTHYTELLLRLARDARPPWRYALRDWLDLFNHRLISLFYRAWEKYRFYIAYGRGEFASPHPDPFTRCLFSLIGLGERPLRNRLRVSRWEETEEGGRERVLAGVDDFALLHYSGYLAHRPRCALSLEILVGDYFRLPVQIRQFQGQWLVLEPDDRSRMGEPGVNCELGRNLVAGARVWDVQSKFRLRLGPLSYARFAALLPDRAPAPERKMFFLLSHLVRLYVGPELDFEVQLVLRAAEVPECRLGAGPLGARLGWNMWIRSRPLDHDADDPVFEGQDPVVLRPSSLHS